MAESRQIQWSLCKLGSRQAAALDWAGSLERRPSLRPLLQLAIGVLLSVGLCHSTVLPANSKRDTSDRSKPTSLGLTPPGQNVPDRSQDDPTSLTTQPLRREITGGAVQSFSFSLAAGQYVRVLIERTGITLQATLFDSHHNQLVDMDSPSGGHGPIYISLIADAPTDCRLEVRSTEKWANPGKFEVRIEELRDAVPADKDRIAAETFFSSASSLAKKNTEESRAAALDSYKKSLEIWQSLQDSHWTATTLYVIGQLYASRGELAEAAKSFDKSLDPVLTSQLGEDDWRLIASAENDRALMAAYLGQSDKAFELADGALAAYRNHGDRRGEASALTNKGIAYVNLGSYPEAIKYFEQALPLRRAENDQVREFNLINNIGAMYDKLGEPGKALESCARTLQVWQSLYDKGELIDPDRLAAALNNTAAAYERTGEWQKARESYEKALNVSLKTGNAQRQASTLNNLGNFYQQWGDAVRARSYYEAALELIRTKVKDPEAEANALTQIGAILMSEGKASEALSYFSKSRAIPQAPEREAQVLNYLAMLSVHDGKPAQAIALYDEALDKVIKQANLRAEAATRTNRAEAYQRVGQSALALKDLETARSLWQKLKDEQGEALALQGLANVKREGNELAEAVRKNNEAIRIIESLRTRVTSYQLRASYFANQQTYYQSSVDFNMTLYQRTHDRQRLALGLNASERSRARSLLDTLFASGESTNEPPASDLLAKERELEQKIRNKSDARTQLLSKTPNIEVARKIDNELSGLIDEADRVRDLIKGSNPKYASLKDPTVLVATEIQHQLEPDTLLFEYSLGEERSYVWAVTSNSIDGFELPARKQIEAAANQIVKSLADRNRAVNGETATQGERRREQARKDFEAASAELSDLVIRPVATLLGTKRLVVVADGALQLVSFAALPLPGNTAAKQRRLIDDHEIVYEPSASVLALQRSELANRKQAQHAVAILADPVFDKDDGRVAAALAGPSFNGQPKSNGSAGPPVATADRQVNRALEDIGLERFSRLPSSAVEAQKIVAVAPQGESNEALDFDANRERAMSGELSKYRIVHFATHAVISYEHPELSGIVLSLVDRKGQSQDGYLRLHDIYNLNLPADLIVLSACQTGIGKEIKGEGLIALTRGFMYAGAQRVVASLWKVDDAATAQLMAEFYNQIFTNGQRPAAALRAAQLQLAKRRSPADWAGFVLQGEWK